VFTIRVPFESNSDLEELVSQFESCTLPHERWTHAAHLSVATAYALQFEVDALDRMRKGILKLNAVHGVEQTLTGGYHETLTIAWMRLVHHGLRETEPDAEPWARVNAVVAALSDKKMLLAYYSREAIMSPEARFGWLEPDLAPLP
jgi:hypothetical protein